MSLSYYEQLTRFTYKHQQWVTQNHLFDKDFVTFLTILLCTLLEGMQRVNFYGFVFSFLYPAEFLLAHCCTPHFTQKYLHNFLMNALTVHSCTFANIFFLSQFLFSFPCPESFPTYLAKCCQFFCALTFLSIFFACFSFCQPPKPFFFFFVVAFTLSAFRIKLSSAPPKVDTLSISHAKLLSALFYLVFITVFARSLSLSFEATFLLNGFLLLFVLLA